MSTVKSLWDYFDGRWFMDVVFNGNVKNDNGSVIIRAGRGSVLFAVHTVSTLVKGKHYVPHTCKRVAWFSSLLMNGFFLFHETSESTSESQIFALAESSYILVRTSPGHNYSSIPLQWEQNESVSEMSKLLKGVSTLNERYLSNFFVVFAMKGENRKKICLQANIFGLYVWPYKGRRVWRPQLGSGCLADRSHPRSLCQIYSGMLGIWWHGAPQQTEGLGR